MPVSERPCRHCSKPFIPSKHAGNRQLICGDARCKKAAKKLCQAAWVARNPDYFSGPENTQRVQQWRANHPDWRQNQATARAVPAQKSSPQTDSCNAQKPQFGPLQDLVPGPQSLVLVGLASLISGSVLQDEVHNVLFECLRRGSDLLGPSADASLLFQFNSDPSTHGKTPNRSGADPPLATAL